MMGVAVAQVGLEPLVLNKLIIDLIPWYAIMATTGFLFGEQMSKLNRQQRRALNKMAGKQATSTIDLMLNIGDKCLTCNAPFDRMSKEMAMTWYIEVYKQARETRLYCPDCKEKRK